MDQTLTERCRSQASRKELENYVTISEYSKRKNVAVTPVLKAIASGRITPIVVGSNQLLYIDWETYGSVPFQGGR